MAESRSTINVVLFSGGSGTRSLTDALRKHPQISLTIIINAYDDGLSTGRLRRFIPTMLGPSDVRKNINRLMPVAERSQKALKFLSDYRLPVSVSRDSAVSFLHCLVEQAWEWLPGELAFAARQLSVNQACTLSTYSERFLEYSFQQERLDRTFDFTDCALGNIFFSGCYLQEDQDFNSTIDSFTRFYEVDSASLLNITLGENLFLVAEKEDGTFLRSEADIVTVQSAAKISELFLLDSAIYRRQVELADSTPAGGWRSLFEEANRTPRLNTRAAHAIANADVIIYGPGTQHSSLFPSYMTEGLAEAVVSNRRADKIFIGNIHRDNDIQQDDAADLARKFLRTMSRKGKLQVEWADLVSHFFLQLNDGAENGRPKSAYLPFDPDRFIPPLNTVRLKNWEAAEGRHDGHYVLNELQQIVQSHIDIELQRLQYMVSIIVPVLNEEKTIEQVLKSVLALDFQPLGLTKEVIVVDGGSSDHTTDLARAVRSVKVLQLPHRSGRGAALRLGIDQARGSIIAFFPGDDEYDPRDLYQLVAAITRTSFRAVFGSRVAKCIALSAVLKRIYQRNWFIYAASKYGGMLLSISTLLLYNRYITDTLTSVKAFDSAVLRSLCLESNGRELDTEIVAKLCRRREYLLELPVDYRPRTRAEGKKITLLDGIRSVAALFKYRRTTGPELAASPSLSHARTAEG
jgi:2-phospho-L-lactate transferase/gluconeogenesis factor (CofD/UPF0052 family)